MDMNKNINKCHCCGQDRPFPTEPGIWEYNECPTMPVKYNNWIKVEIKHPLPDDRDGMDGLRIWKDGEMIWWPIQCAWRKYNEN